MNYKSVQYLTSSLPPLSAQFIKMAYVNHDSFYFPLRALEIQHSESYECHTNARWVEKLFHNTHEWAASSSQIVYFDILYIFFLNQWMLIWPRHISTCQQLTPAVSVSAKQ